jgi:hypothetical protein
MAPVSREASWTAPALWRFHFGPASQHPQMKAPEARQIVAHGETVGLDTKTIQAPAGATEINTRKSLSPHPGLDLISSAHPRLAPWAII